MPRERLYRSRSDRVLFGVAGGMADWLDQDPAVVRLLWALFVVFGGVGLVIYIIAAIVIPEEPYEAADATAAAATGGQAPTYPQSRAERRAARRASSGSSSAAIIFGIILIVAGGWFLLREFIPWIDLHILGPVVLIGIGVVLVVAAMGRSTAPQRPAAPPMSPPMAPPPSAPAPAANPKPEGTEEPPSA